MQHHHAAFGLPIEELDIVVVEPSRHIQSIIRSILLTFKVSRIRLFDNVEDALESIVSEPPSVILSEWKMPGASGYQMLRMIRHVRMSPVCYVPLMFVTSYATGPFLDKAMRGGAHNILAKPISASLLHKRLRWLTADSRPFVADKAGFLALKGISTILNMNDGRRQMWDKVRAANIGEVRQYSEVMNVVDQMFGHRDAQEMANTDGSATTPGGRHGFADVKDIAS